MYMMCVRLVLAHPWTLVSAILVSPLKIASHNQASNVCRIVAYSCTSKISSSSLSTFFFFRFESGYSSVCLESFIFL